MRLMLDTQILAWLAARRAKLNAMERAAIEAHADHLLVSVISIWEMRLKWRASPRKAERDDYIKADEALRFCEVRGILVASFSAEDAVAVVDPPLAHKDPFDDVLLAHAQRLDATVLTRDDALINHPLAYHP